MTRLERDTQAALDASLRRLGERLYALLPEIYDRPRGQLFALLNMPGAE